MDTRIAKMECEKPQMEDVHYAYIRLNVQGQYPKIRALLRPMFQCFVASFGRHLCGQPLAGFEHDPPFSKTGIRNSPNKVSEQVYLPGFAFFPTVQRCIRLNV